MDSSRGGGGRGKSFSTRLGLIYVALEAWENARNTDAIKKAFPFFLLRGLSRNFHCVGEIFQRFGRLIMSMKMQKEIHFFLALQPTVDQCSLK